MAPYTPLSLSQAQGGTELPVCVIPGASRNTIGGVRDGALLIRVSTPPEKGKANQAVARLLARSLKIRKAQVVLIRGAKSRKKAFLIDGIDPQLLSQRLEHLIPSDGENE